MPPVPQTLESAPRLKIPSLMLSCWPWKQKPASKLPLTSQEPLPPLATLETLPSHHHRRQSEPGPLQYYYSKWDSATDYSQFLNSWECKSDSQREALSDCDSHEF
ncbi:hypothetical protein ABVK25_001837 [Lepraria finkii]|uniref:Uncharacterized protein n=1 Tax=Lepraria finkii TaxID=1340010 RepID=A0ABR4BN83_9LECA